MTTTAMGAFTGKVQTGSGSVSIKGQLRFTGSDVSFARLDLTGLTIGASTNVSLALTLDASQNRLDGSISNGTNTAAVEGWKNCWPGRSGKAAPIKGTHSFYLGKKASNNEEPDGYGFGTLVVTENEGKVTVAGGGADGVKFTSSGFVGPDGQVLLCFPLYGGHGSFCGKLNLSTDGTHVVSGDLSWLKRQGLATDLVYRSGFGPVDLSARGGLYAPPAKGSAVMAPSGVTGSQATLNFTEGGLSDKMVFNVSINGANKASVVSLTDKVNLSIAGATGAISGDVNLNSLISVASSRKATFIGQIVAIDGVARGYGFFLLPIRTGPIAPFSPKLSGKVILEPVPAE